MAPPEHGCTYPMSDESVTEGRLCGASLVLGDPYSCACHSVSLTCFLPEGHEGKRHQCTDESEGVEVLVTWEPKETGDP